MKTCTKCKEKKQLSEFHLIGKRKPGKRESWCKLCKNASKRKYYNAEKGLANHRRSRYGLTEDEIIYLWDIQNGQCGICKKILNSKFCVDHDHKDGKVRGLLCYRCNMMLSIFENDTSAIDRMVSWLGERLSVETC